MLVDRGIMLSGFKSSDIVGNDQLTTLLYPKDVFPPTEAQLFDFLNSCRAKLTHLKITQFEGEDCISDRCLEAISQRHSTMQYLGIKRRAAVTDNGLYFMAETCRWLTRLELSDCDDITDAGISRLSSRCPLAHVQLQHCQSITDAGISDLTANCRHAL
jgi:hypothetical protein